jgi:exopolysaccharide biosynthesis polyprenyl glycosylphosphotransferase
MLRRFSINFAIFSILVDGALVAFSLWFSAFSRPFLNNLGMIEAIPTPISIPSLLYLIFPTIWVFINLSLSIYDGKKYLRVVDEFSALTLGVLIASVSSAGILYFSYREISRVLFVLFVINISFLSLGWRIVARLLFRFQKSQPVQARRVLAVGSGPLGQSVAARILESGPENLLFLGFVDDNVKAQTSPALLGTTAELKKLVVSRQVSDVVIALPYSSFAALGDVVQQLEELPVNVWVALGFFDLALYKTAIENFAGIPMVDLRASAIDDYQRMVKRAFDLILVTLGMLFALPVMIFIAVVIRIDDGQPVLFRQKRAGENGRVFEMLKFRTMIREAEKMQTLVGQADENGLMIHKTKDDPRVTRVGRLLRRLSLDELPQLFNILEGTMSLVGPRPEMPYLVEKYQPWQRKRFAVPPGLTGWWQINGRSDRPMHLHTEDDLYYIQNYSIWLDIQILIRTVWVVLIGKGSY